MKFLAFILSIYILALNFTPCEDGNAINNDIKIEISHNGDLDLDHNNLDSCSPFCQCHCCHIHATSFNLDDSDEASHKISTKIYLHFDGLGKDITNSILQPPRV